MYFESTKWRWGVGLLLLITGSVVADPNDDLQRSAAAASAIWFPKNIELKASDSLVEDWMSDTVARNRIAVDPAKPTTIVLARDIRFEDVRYSVRESTVPKNVIIIADSLRLDGLVEFDLAPEFGGTLRERSGGTLTLLARHLVVGRKGFLTCRSFGTFKIRQGETQRDYDFTALPENGNVVIVFEDLQLAQSLESTILNKLQRRSPSLLPDRLDAPFDATAKQATVALLQRVFGDKAQQQNLVSAVSAKSIYDDDLIDIINAAEREQARAEFNKNRLRTFQDFCVDTTLDDPALRALSFPKPPAGHLTSKGGVEELYPAVPQLRGIFSLWILRRMETLAVDISNALRQLDRAGLIQMFKDFRSFPRYSIAPEYVNEFLTLQDSLTKLRYSVILPLWTRTVRISVADQPIDCQVISEGDSLVAQVAPQLALLSETTVDGQKTIGLFRYDNQRDQLEIYVTARLSADPRLIAEVDRTLRRDGESCKGVFSAWQLSPDRIQFEGVDPEQSSIILAGNTLHCKLVFAKAKALALAQFSSKQGIPLNFKWTYLGDPKLSGELKNVSLSRARREIPEISVNGREVSNRGHTPQMLEFVRFADGSFRNFLAEGFPELQPAQTLSIPQNPADGSGILSIPAEAVVYLPDTKLLERDFSNLSTDDLSEEITVFNELPTADALSKALLDHLDITVTYEYSTPVKAQTWRVEGLLTSPNPGHAAKHWFFHPQADKRRLRINGRAHYADGGWCDLREILTESPIIRIAADDLNKPNKP
jgi:hypothetical protein